MRLCRSIDATASPCASAPKTTGRADFAARAEQALVEIGEKPRRIVIAGRGAAAHPLQDFAALRAIGDAKPGRHQRRRNSLQIGKLIGRALDPVHLALLQREISGEHFGDSVRPRLRLAVRLIQNISRGGDKTERGERGDAQGEPKLEIDPGRSHGRFLHGWLLMPPHVHSRDGTARMEAARRRSGILPGPSRDARAFGRPAFRAICPLKQRGSATCAIFFSPFWPPDCG